MQQHAGTERRRVSAQRGRDSELLAVYWELVEIYGSGLSPLFSPRIRWRCYCIYLAGIGVTPYFACRGPNILDTIAHMKHFGARAIW